jgi:molybdopterin-guanine dinucleotide biosynthesis protein B
MRIFGLAGWSGSGKTTLMKRLIPALRERGLTVATVKHTHHNASVATDEARALAEAGAVETMIASPSRWALLHEQDNDLGAVELASLVRGVDLVLVEGFKYGGHAKLEVHDPALGRPPVALEDQAVVAVAADQPIPGLAKPRFHRDDVAAIADFIVTYTGVVAGEKDTQGAGHCPV